MQTEDKREQILEAARKVFSRFGYNKTNLDDIGEVVGMKKNSLYHYFKNKEDLFKSLLLKEAEYHFDQMQKIIDKEKTASNKLHALFSKGRKLGFERMNVYQGTVAAKIEIVGVIESYYKEFISRQIDLVKEILILGYKTKEFIKHDSDKLACDIVEMNLSIEQREYQKSKAQFLHEINYEMIDERLSNLLNFIIKGLTKA